MREITKTENAVFSIILVALMLYSLSLQYYFATVAAIWMFTYLKWCVVKYSDFARTLDKIYLYSYAVLGVAYTILCVLTLFK
jgi:hypothetical protein